MKIKKNILVIVISLILIFSLSSCKSEVSESVEIDNNQETKKIEKQTENEAPITTESVNEKETVTIVDLAGREVVLKLPVDRVILANGRFVREFSAICGDDFLNQLVGFGSDFEKFDIEIYNKYAEKFPKIKEIEKIGHFSEGGLNIEKIVSLNPDVVFIQKWFLKAAGETIDILDKAGIAVVIVDFSIEPIKGPYKSILLMGQILGKNERAEAIAKTYNEEIKKVFDTLSQITKERPNVYVENGGRGPNEYGKTYGNCAWGNIVELAGGNNIAKDVIKGKMGDIAPEYLIETDPDNIVIAGYSSNGVEGALKFGYDTKKEEARALLEAYTKREGWENLSAVKNGKVTGVAMGHCLQIDNFYSLQRLAKDFYPEEFKMLNPEENFKNFHDKYSVVEFSGTWSIGIK